jgi:UDP-glucose 4-epimerase
VIAAHGVDRIIHFAGSVVVPDSMRDPLGYCNNTMTTRNLLNAAVKCNISRFIFSSTAAVYGNPDQTPVPKTPTSAFALRFIVQADDRNHAARCRLRARHELRGAALFQRRGRRSAGRIGLATVGATHLLKIAVEAATGQRAKIDVFGTDYPTADGSCVRDFIHVSDLAEAHRCAEISRTGRSATLNCGYGRGYSVLETIEAVRRASGAISRFSMPSAARRHHDHDRRHGPHPRHAGLDAATTISTPSPAMRWHGKKSC